ncbi:MAG: nucleotide exchange factor GrpE [Anaerolineales bacterium]|nr:nucleotide exchange factor GrpE [Anaerolineales bacterium]MCW5855799.1 nucleotide exchange factor GrpE [Anaerolineales bacterium]
MEETQEQHPEQAGEEQAELTALQAQLAEAEALAAQNLEGWQRAQAEFANYKKRQSRDQEMQAADIRGRVFQRFLEVSDDLELALKARPQDGEGAAWAQGIELIYQKLMTYLQAEGLTRVYPLGETFDPNLHEALSQEENSEYQSGTVSEVLRPGYLLGERVLRPAVVKVAK